MEDTLNTHERPVAIGQRAAPAPAPKPNLSLVESPPPAVRARQLYQDARRAALEHLDRLGAAVETARELSDDVVNCGDLVDPGLRELARQLSDVLAWKSKTLQALVQRQRQVRA
jgi:hypothetical protein